MKWKERLLEFARRSPILKRIVKPLPPPNRRVFVGNRGLAEVTGGDFQVDCFKSNVVITSQYTIWNFLPLNLFGQLKRIANFYFVCVSVILLVVPTSIGAMTTVVPLLFVLAVTAVKQGYEDVLRHKADRSVNDHPTTVLRQGQLKTVKSKNILVGDIVRVSDDGIFPCDLILLSSSNPDGECSVQTTNLDGETNLKVFRCVHETRTLTKEDELDVVRARIECEQPTPDLYSFKGRIDIRGLPGESLSDSETLIGHDNSLLVRPLGSENVLLRGAKLKSTDFVYGCAVYTGQETKMALNSKQKSNKRSRVEKQMNTLLLVFLAILLVESAICVALEYWWIDSFWLRRAEDGKIVTSCDDSGKPIYLDRQGKRIWLPWYLSVTDDILCRTSLNVFENFLAFTVVFNYIIPISLYVTIEMQKFLGSIFFGWDLGMYDSQSEQAAKANTSDLNEELGQVNYLFCDKTGTLTENDMQFRCCCIGTVRYEDRNGVLQRSSAVDETDGDTVSGSTSGQAKLNVFLSAIAVCHTARVECKATANGSVCSTLLRSGLDSVDRAPSNVSTEPSAAIGSDGSTSLRSGLNSVDRASNVSTEPSANSSTCSTNDADVASYVYHSSSPDEKALLDACRRYGVVYHGTQSNGQMHITLKDGKPVDCQLLHVLEFDSDRKCMSVIIKDSSDEHWLICKGAESSVLKNCTSGPIAAIQEAVDSYARLGYRTLVVAQRKLTEDEFSSCDKELRSAASSLENRAQELRRVYCTIECGLEALGATAVEDRLQDEVPETIEALRAADIKVWVLTGDKEETAVNISYSAGLFDSNTELLRVVRNQTADDVKKSLTEAYRTVESSKETKFGLVMDGQSLTFLLGSNGGSVGAANERTLRLLCQRVTAVLCCRMTPIQKALVVKMVKADPAAPVTAAIGDGANDVSMIQTAHVGLGIMGKEGRHATRCSDYAFARFKFVRRALFVHGHLYYMRLANLIQYSFYKNVAFCSVQVSYSYFTAFSAQTIYDSYFLLFFNLAFTALPILLYGLFEQHLPPEVLESSPRLYRKNKGNVLLAPGHFAKWFSLGVWHTLVLFYVPYYFYGWSDSYAPIGLTELGAIIYTICIYVVNTKLIIVTYYWSWLAFFGFIFTYAIFMSMTFFYSNVILPSFMVSSLEMFGVFNDMFSAATFFLLCALCFVVALLPDLFLRFYRDLASSTYRRLVRQGSPAEVVYTAFGDKLTINFTGTAGKLTLSRENIVDATASEGL